MLNTDLFGNIVPVRPSATPVSVRSNRGKVRVFHTSWEEQPPHMLDAPDTVQFDPENNVHPDAIHMGTPQAANAFARTHVHEYEIDLEHPDVSPVTWGDSPGVLDTDEYSLGVLKKYSTSERKQNVFRPTVVDFQERMRGQQEGLFENTSPDLERAVSKNTVIPYRNRREDIGSISFIVPKTAVGGAVRYIGRTDSGDFRRGLTRKD